MNKDQLIKEIMLECENESDLLGRQVTKDDYDVLEFQLHYQPVKCLKIQLTTLRNRIQNYILTN